MEKTLQLVAAFIGIYIYIYISVYIFYSYVSLEILQAKFSKEMEF